MDKILGIPENYDFLVSEFVKLTDEQDDTALFLQFCDKRVEFFHVLLSKLYPLCDDHQSIEPCIANMVKVLFNARRFYDLAELFSALKLRNEQNTETGRFFPVLKKVLKQGINDLFILSLTYPSSDIDMLFFEVLGDDMATFIELISHLFEERKLFNATLSTNIHKKFIEIADENIPRFVQHTNSYLLAYYLSKLPELQEVRKDHIAKWATLILASSANRKHIDKILEAMKIYPSFEILLLLLTVSRDDQRSAALKILSEQIKKNRDKLLKFYRETIYFLTKSADSAFYNFNQIPHNQKLQFAQIMIAVNDHEIISFAHRKVLEKNEERDSKKFETKKVFILLLGHLHSEKRNTAEILRDLLKGSQLENDEKQEIVKVLKNINAHAIP